MIFDVNSSILEGSIGILPRRITVNDDDYDLARETLIEAGLKNEFKA
jgi:hypothetical protein